MAREELTAQETALYDRQIRVWGVDAQRRLSKAHVLVAGLTGSTVEFCKNIVLAGVGSLTLVDDHAVSLDDLHANFLIAPDESIYGGRSLAEVCSDALREFNPMVQVSSEKGEVSQFTEESLDRFDVVILAHCSLANKLLVNEKCRKKGKRIAFYSVECKDSCGEIFVDLQRHCYAKKTSDGSTEEEEMLYFSLQDAISVPWKVLPKKMSKLYYAMRVLERFERSNGCGPGETSVFDLQDLLKMRKQVSDEQGVNESVVPTDLLERLLRSGKKEHPSVCAILGGILGQEVIRAISGKGDPLKNFFYFDAADGKGVIEEISPPTS